jgi:hypothetical protein
LAIAAILAIFPDPRKSAVKQLLMLLVVQPEVPDHQITRFPISVISENQR